MKLFLILILKHETERKKFRDWQKAILTLALKFEIGLLLDTGP